MEVKRWFGRLRPLITPQGHLSWTPIRDHPRHLMATSTAIKIPWINITERQKEKIAVIHITWKKGNNDKRTKLIP